MRNLISFLINNIAWFLFIFLEIICCYFIFNTDSYQKSIFLNSSNQISGKVYTVSGNIVSYFGLRDENQELLIENTKLNYEVATLRNYIEQRQSEEDKSINAFIKDSSKYIQEYNFILARVVNNSVNKSQNTITINKGSNDGIAINMGVISHNGIVGEVRAVSSNFAVIQSVLNSNSRLSCKVLRTNTDATLVWNGKDSRYASLINYPKYENIQKGDTIITSGFTDLFPEGVLVGVVENFEEQVDNSFYSLNVELSTKMSSITNVIVIDNKNKTEKQELENKVDNAQR